MSVLNMFSTRLCVSTRLLKSCLPTVQSSCRLPVSAHSGLHCAAAAAAAAAAQFNSNRTSVVRCGRQNYERLYPVLLVRPDGSTVTIRYKEPRRVLTMPINLSALSDEQRRLRLKKREVKKTKAEATIRYDDDFIADNYRHLWK
ncbi:large ribosomal subunit protein mL55 [Nelusetta ayraudi]|uniref:large ribosomal subunit protein mL55 n=1 Tax=Nelusetta ayraudi TaxID=303726 RepID=UPI003F710959